MCIHVSNLLFITQKKAGLQTHLGIVMHFVLGSWVDRAFVNSSNPPVFFSFLTRLFTAFSDHLSSLSCSPFFHANKRLTIGGVKGEIEVIFAQHTPHTTELEVQPVKCTRFDNSLLLFWCLQQNLVGHDRSTELYTNNLMEMPSQVVQ